MDRIACSRIIPAHIGAKLKKCSYPHNNDGSESRMVEHKCNAKRTIFVPVDPNLRVACVVYTSEPHSHPMLPATKASYDLKALYAQCVQAGGALTSTVRSVEKAASTQLILNGSTPTTLHPALGSKRVKREIIRNERIKQSPFGTSLKGVISMLREDAAKRTLERYVHLVTTGPSGGTLVFTFQPFLLSLIHEAHGIHVDTTFKRTLGELKLVIWCSDVQRAVTIGRIYTDKGDREHFKTLFDQMQMLVLKITGKPMRFKRLTQGGNLLSMNIDLELAQALGFGDSFLPTNDPDYSKIKTDDPEVIIEYTVRACITHVKRYGLVLFARLYISVLTKYWSLVVTGVTGEKSH
ncbi:hypothetical protein VKT23_020428 [Stygiomarasmius scandens]|uniref:Uncharacterized protein n=1 Tax=Marasmiellus scandens TaxID=2682957 RepID=A0ABR1IKV7_9AGAR